ncbi:hypothetical protein CHARACLAT_020334 [Characodon lateralis]|uniref:Apple domain-containing protein n=1 Tax=Characodon lateralis TaxID=208331 RepID=A0ABU7D3C7_9TELE|nr:hypothetical protein [Characodon lateralis]
MVEMCLQRCASYAIGTNTPLYHHRCWLLNFADNSPDSPFPLWPGGHNVHDFQNEFEMWTHQTTAHFPLCISPPQMSSGSEEPVRFLGVVDMWLWLYMVEF